jgi:hypothetical protein
MGISVVEKPMSILYIAGGRLSRELRQPPAA